MTLEQRIAHERMVRSLPVKTHKVFPENEESICPKGVNPVDVGKKNRDRIQELKAKGLTPREVGEELGLVHSTVYRWWR